MPSTLSLGDPASTGVVFIECQNGVFGEGAAVPALQEQLGPMVARLVDLADAARAAGLVTVQATCEGAGAVPQPPAPLYRLIGPASADWKPGHPATKVIDELADERDLVIPRRRGLVSTHNTDLLPSLRALGVQTIVYAGVSTNIAIPACVIESVEEGFNVIVPRDAVAGPSEAYSRDILKNTIGLLAVLTDVQSLKDHWKSPQN